jgi:transglutaminase-like putative cysteine protease
MTFSIAAELAYQVADRSTLILNIHALASRSQTLRNENFTVTEGCLCEFFELGTVNSRYVRIDTRNVSALLITYSVEAENHPAAYRIQNIYEVPIQNLNPSALPFLFPSRYCESDKLGDEARLLFGHLEHPLAQASAISEWLYENIRYEFGSSDPATSAEDTYQQRAGVCRDFAHLAIAFCRSLSIPARYFTGYACNMVPPDFHACFEVCVGNDWYLFDPTRLSAPDGLVRIAAGHDAADCAVANLYGSLTLTRSFVSCTSPDFHPATADELEGKAILLEPQ